MQIVKESVMSPDTEETPGIATVDAVPAIVTREDAVRMLSRLRATLPSPSPPLRRDGGGNGRRESPRWVPPDTVTIDVYDGDVWHAVEVLDCGIPGVRVMDLPGSVGAGPAVMRLTTPRGGTVLVVGNVIWRDTVTGSTGLQFTFQTDEDREAWFEGLVVALLSRHAMD